MNNFIKKWNEISDILDIIIPHKLYAFCLGLLTGITCMLIDDYLNDFKSYGIMGGILITLFIFANLLNYLVIFINYIKYNKEQKNG